MTKTFAHRFANGQQIQLAADLSDAENGTIKFTSTGCKITPDISEEYRRWVSEIVIEEVYPDCSIEQRVFLAKIGLGL